ncbi:MAG: hypothetical protein GY720_13715 [bacterium]|nr:hypothetical protein [bacterium]
MTLVLEPRTARHRLTMGVLAVAAAVLLSGCPPQEPADGNYPNLEALVASIDWTGEGTAPRGVAVLPGDSELQIRTEIEYPASDSTALQVRIAERLKAFPTVFAITRDKATNAWFEGDGWYVYVATSRFGDGTPAVAVGVGTVDNDDRAVKALDPVVEVLGTIPHHPSWDEHPRLEAALATIDWTGDGTISRGGGVRPGGDELPVETAVPYFTTEPETLELEIENRLKSFDTVFTLISYGAGPTIFAADNLKIYVPDTGRSPVAIWVATLADEDAAIESLEPVIEVLGTIP